MTLRINSRQQEHEVHLLLPFCKVVLCAQKPLPPDYPTNPKTVGDHIKKRRYELKMTQEQVAEFFGVARNTISDWEWGTQFPNLKLVGKVTLFLGYSPYDNLSTMTTGNKIRTARKMLGLTLEDAAKQLGVCKDTFTAWEYDRVTPRRRYMDGLNRLLADAHLQ